MEKTLIINAAIGEVRTALIVDDTPTQIALLRDHEPSLLGQQFFARVLRVATDLDGAFLDLGKFQAFLPRRNIRTEANQKGKALNSLIHEGEMIKVRITRDAMPSDNKLAITAQIKTNVPSGQKPGSASSATHFIQQIINWPGYENIRNIVVDDLNMLAAIKQQLNVENASTINLSAYNGDEPLFAVYGIEDKLSEVIENKIPLPSGGWITIEATSALTAIDVNGGGSGHGRQAADNAVKINLEAIDAVVNSLVFQNIGGLIVVDFLDMQGKEAKANLEEAMKKALARDPLHVEYGRFSPFGLMEIKRQRSGEGLRERLVDKFDKLRPDYVALYLLRQAMHIGLAPSSGKIEITAPLATITWLQNQTQLSIDLKEKTAREILLKVGDNDVGSVSIIT